MEDELLESEMTGLTDNQAEPEPVNNQDDHISNSEEDDVVYSHGKKYTVKEEGAEEKADAKALYTPEELKEISTDKIDLERLDPKLRETYKSMQSGITRKNQELSDLKRDYESRMAQIQQQQQSQQRPDINQLYLENPQAVEKAIHEKIVNLNRQIIQVKQKARELRYSDPDESMKLEAYEDNLLSQRMGYESTRQALQNNALEQISRSEHTNKLHNETLNAVKSSIKDFDVVRPNVEEFAVKQGLSMDSISRLTDPNLVGVDAVREFASIMHNLYQKDNAISNIRNSEKKVVPRNIENGLVMSGMKESSGKKSIVDMSLSEIDEYLEGR